eukprot:m.27401 g.27401  ORF g.27401 m.27401 type:complete len:67 (-) comp8924_c0_seq1:16-216(-)
MTYQLHNCANPLFFFVPWYDSIISHPPIIALSGMAHLDRNKLFLPLSGGTSDVSGHNHPLWRCCIE